ncbi:MAG: hypothetical protein GF331_17225 [Chitinivibrionales bacterium]|nr:hypothetical protein [Chitinivibrionales bacterium]
MDIFQELIRAFQPGSDGFVFMWVLAGVAVAAVGLTIERWLAIRKRTDVNALALVDALEHLIEDKRYDEAYRICISSGRRALPRVLGAGIRRAMKNPEMIRSAMEEESLHMVPLLERRADFILMFGNISTLLGLMGTIYGLILSFAAVARPDVAAVEKSSMLASGISAAMNTTLFGLMIAVPCILAYSLLRARIDNAVQDIDRYATAVLKWLLPGDTIQRNEKITAKRLKPEVDTEPNIAPMMNLMVILIPLLLTSAEFVKIGAIELKLPEASQGGGGGDDNEQEQAKLNLGVVITSKGFNLFHYYKSQEEKNNKRSRAQESEEPGAEIPKKGDEYDFGALNEQLAEVKRRVLLDIVRAAKPDVPANVNLVRLYKMYKAGEQQFTQSGMFADHEDIKIVAEDKIRYEAVVSTMDAARGVRSAEGRATMFPNVSLAGGIAY